MLLGISAVLAKVSVCSPRKSFIFFIWKIIFWMKVSKKNILFTFEKGSTAWNATQMSGLQTFDDVMAAIGSHKGGWKVHLTLQRSLDWLHHNTRSGLCEAVRWILFPSKLKQIEDQFLWRTGRARKPNTWERQCFLFQNLNKLIFGYFDPEKIILDN